MKYLGSNSVYASLSILNNRLLSHGLRRMPNVAAHSIRCLASQPLSGTEKEAPVQFSSSKAFEIQPKLLFGEPKPFSVRLSVVLSLGSFLLYFLALREESDIDERLDASNVEADMRRYEMEKLRESIEKNRNNLDIVAGMEERLSECLYEDYIAKKKAKKQQGFRQGFQQAPKSS